MFRYRFMEDGKLDIVGLEMPRDFTGKVLTIPGEIDGNTVRKITRMQSDILGELSLELVIEEGVEVIGRLAFFDMNLTKLTLPKSIKTIEKNAFSYNKLGTVVFPEGLKIIGPACFFGCEIPVVDLPDSLVYLGESSFQSAGVEMVNFGSGLSSIPKSAFTGNKIKTLSLPPTLKKIGSRAFFDNSIEELTISNGVTTLGPDAFRKNKLDHMVYPGSIKEIYDFRKDEGFSHYFCPSVKPETLDSFNMSGAEIYCDESSPVHDKLVEMNLDVNLVSSEGEFKSFVSLRSKF